jgi:RecB family exonuclease
MVAADVNYGREVLLADARGQGASSGRVPTNLRAIANDLAFVALSASGLRVAGDIEIAHLIDSAVASVASRRAPADILARMAGSPGLLRAFRDSVLEARMAGVSAATLRNAAGKRAATLDLADVLGEYERLLAASGLADPAALFALALTAFDAEADYVLDGETVIVEGLSTRGLPGELIRKLLQRGARVLPRQAPVGLPVPAHVVSPVARDTEAAPGAKRAASLLAYVAAQPSAVSVTVNFDQDVVACDIFAAASPADELREICRRVISEDLRWDQVEIVATDPDEYGIALDALTQQLGIGATMLRGIPLARTRLGRAIERWLGWLEEGLPADVLREALEAGEVRVPASDITSTALARELRPLSIGWGRARYEAALACLKQGRTVAAMHQRDGESDDSFAARRRSRQAVCSALATLLERLLALAPAVPARGSDAQTLTSASALARATLGYLELVATHGQAEEQTRERVCSRLEQLAALESDAVGFGHAMAALRDLLADVRAWPLETGERKPWSSSGGMMHLTDVAHAGTTGRPRVFVVGMDADRTAGPIREDPLLNDSARRALGVAGLPTTAERREEWDYALACALAGLHGRVTLSYSIAATADGRESSPSPLLLGAWRLIRADQSLSYKDLREALYPPASAVPAQSESGAKPKGSPAQASRPNHIDARDVWLDALTDGPLLLDGSEAVAESFRGIAAGLRAHAAAQAAPAGEFHGLVPEAGPLLDPAATGRQISPSALETQAACALRWFYRYGLAIFPPDDPEYDPEQWLDARARGALLHEVFEAFTREYAGRQASLDKPEARERVLAAASAAIAKYREQLPPPSEAVFEAQSAEIQRAALAFLLMERDRWAEGDHGIWSRFELKFGWENAPGVYELPDRAVLSIKGRADRVDAMPDGTLRVVDYKTGKPRGYGNEPKAGPFHGGRRLQPALYVAAVAQAEGVPVSRFEYRFPTDAGQNEVIAYGAAALEPVRQIIGDLVAQIRAGEFVPTNDVHDCAFCDYQAICRVGSDGQKTVSPRAAWARANGDVLPEYTKLIARRGRDGAPDGGAGNAEEDE